MLFAGTVLLSSKMSSPGSANTPSWFRSNQILTYSSQGPPPVETSTSTGYVPPIASVVSEAPVWSLNPSLPEVRSAPLISTLEIHS